MSKNFDVVVIGGGPGGYVAAIRAAQLGLKTACVDDWRNAAGKASPGGTCLNVGCIPSKALIESSEHFHRAAHELAAHGVRCGSVELDLATMLARKDQVVNELTQGVAALFAANKITFFHGRGRMLAARQVEVALHDGGNEILAAAHVILATGSRPSEHPAMSFDGEYVVDSTGALAFVDVPRRLAVIGAGVIGLELGSVWNRLGSEVSLFKSSKGLLPMADADVSREARRLLEKQGLAIRDGVKVTGAAVKGNEVVLELDDGGKQEETFDKVVVAIGRRPNSENIVADDVKLEVDQRGFVVVDDKCATSEAQVWAIGDLVRGPMLAHKASEEGVMVAELIAGHHAQVDLTTVPSVIYTAPEIAWVGYTEQQLKEEQRDFRVGSFPYNANGRARAMGQTDGFVKMLADARTDRLLGVHIIGAQASEMIAQAKIAMEMGAASEDLALTMFAHPSLSEVMHEAALSVDGRAIHAVQKKKR